MTTSRIMLLAGGLALCLLGACKKEESPPDTIPTTAETAEPTATAAPTATATASDSAAVTPVPVTPTTAAKATGQGLEACCAALKAKASGTGMASAKDRAKQAAQLCASMSELVKQGKTTRASALTSLRSAAGTLPPGCS